MISITKAINFINVNNKKLIWEKKLVSKNFKNILIYYNLFLCNLNTYISETTTISCLILFSLISMHILTFYSSRATFHYISSRGDWLRKSRSNSHPGEIMNLWVCSLLLVNRSNHLSHDLFGVSFSIPFFCALSSPSHFFATNTLLMRRPTLCISQSSLRNHPYAEQFWVNALASVINSSFECLKCRVGKLHPVTCARGWLRDATAILRRRRSAFHYGEPSTELCFFGDIARRSAPRIFLKRSFHKK